MELDQAIPLIQHSYPDKTNAQTWADLGCGTGLFTLALATLVPVNSTIYALDRNKSGLKRIPDRHHHAVINKLNMDFVKDEWPLDNLDGILMGNSLHFVEDKHAFIENAIRHMKSIHTFLIIEYDMDKANAWVPYPVSYASLQNLFKQEGYKSIVKLREHRSLYNRANIYSAIIRN